MMEFKNKSVFILIKSFFFTTFFFLSVPGIFPQEAFIPNEDSNNVSTELVILPEEISNHENSAKVLKLSLKEAVKTVIENNLTVQNAKLEMIKTDSGVYKNESKFTWTATAEATSFKTNLPYNAVNIITGTRTSNDKFAVGIEKQFETGTYFRLEASSVRFDSNAFEDPIKSPAAFSFMAIPPLYTGAVTVKLSQELLKYSFGKNEKNIQKIMQTQSMYQRDQLVFQLTNLVAQTLVDYWSLSISDAAVKTFEKLYKSAENIKNLTNRKQAIGLSERFEMGQWNSLLSSVSGQLEQSKLDRDIAKRKMKRILNADPASEISGVTDLAEEIPANIDIDKDLEYAYSKRIDLKNLSRQIEVAKLELENSEAEDMPSFKVTGTYSTKAQTLISPQENFLSLNNGINTFKYPEARGEFNFSYPLWDKGIKADIRDKKTNLQQLETSESDLRKEIKDELKTRYDAIYSSYNVLKSAMKSQAEIEKFAKGVFAQFAQGKYTSIAVKNAFDSVAQAELGTIQARINFNINLLRYDLSKNYIFEKYEIDTDKIIEEMLKRKN